MQIIPSIIITKKPSDKARITLKKKLGNGNFRKTAFILKENGKNRISFNRFLNMYEFIFFIYFIKLIKLI